MDIKQVQHEDDGSWSVYANGRQVIERESYQIASNVAYALEHPGAEDRSECGEVASSILQAIDRHVLDSGRMTTTLSDLDLRILAQRAWDACQGDDLRKLRDEAARRGLQVA
jgi:hypothetical protein